MYPCCVSADLFFEKLEENYETNSFIDDFTFLERREEKICGHRAETAVIVFEAWGSLFTEKIAYGQKAETCSFVAAVRVSGNNQAAAEEKLQKLYENMTFYRDHFSSAEALCAREGVGYTVYSPAMDWKVTLVKDNVFSISEEDLDKAVYHSKARRDEFAIITVHNDAFDESYETYMNGYTSVQEAAENYYLLNNDIDHYRNAELLEVGEMEFRGYEVKGFCLSYEEKTDSEWRPCCRSEFYQMSP